MLDAHSEKELIIGILPESTFLAGKEDSILSEQCLVSEPQGCHRIVAIELGDRIVTTVTPAYPVIESRETVHLTFQQDAMAFFGKEPGLRI